MTPNTEIKLPWTGRSQFQSSPFNIDPDNSRTNKILPVVNYTMKKANKKPVFINEHNNHTHINVTKFWISQSPKATTYKYDDGNS